MAERTTLRYGGSKAEFRKNPTQIAVRPSPGRGRMMDLELEGLARRLPAERRGRLGPFEVVDLNLPEAEVNRERTRLRRSAAVARSSPVYNTSDDGVPFVPEGTLFLSFRDGTASGAIEDVLARHGLEVVTVVDGFWTVRSSDPDTVDIAARLQQEPVVAIAEPDLITPRRLLQFLPDDSLLSQQWHLENRGEINGIAAGLKKGADARVIAAWKRLGGLGSPEAVIAIIDDGFDLTHPDLQGKAVHPWDFIRGNENVAPEPDYFSALAGDWHGTACAGVAAGLPGGGSIAGAAPNAKLVPIRMSDALSSINLEKWFDYVTEKGSWVVSCSWGAEGNVYDMPERVAQAITRCATRGRAGKGCVVVFAAGNSNRNVNDKPHYKNGFATHPDVLAVAASTSLDRRADYSNKGREIAVCAPSAGLGGLGITTSDVIGTYIDASGVERARGYDPGAYHAQFEGTSSSCPLVAGICGLVLSANPDLTAAEVRQIMCSTARKIGPASEYSNGHSLNFGHGCVNADAAVAMAIDARQRGEVPIARVDRRRSPTRARKARVRSHA